MKRKDSRFSIRRTALLLTVIVLLTSTALGQRRPRQPAPDFFFEPPAGSVGFRVGGVFPRADSQIFDFVTEELTLRRDDFRAANFGMDVGIRLNDYLDLVFGFDYSSRTTASEVRDFVDEFDLPIVQETLLSRLPLTGSVRFYPAGKGRQVGQLAWVPRRVAPYVGAGGGVTWYRFRQFGDFVDFRDLIIFTDDLTSEGWTPMLQALGGLEINLSRRFAFAVEARYSWANADLGRDFTGFDPIDLSGLQTTGGLLIRF
jgi:hypothetical protein